MVRTLELVTFGEDESLSLYRGSKVETAAARAAADAAIAAQAAQVNKSSDESHPPEPPSSF